MDGWMKKKLHYQNKHSLHSQGDRYLGFIYGYIWTSLSSVNSSVTYSIFQIFFMLIIGHIHLYLPNIQVWCSSCCGTSGGIKVAVEFKVKWRGRCSVIPLTDISVSWIDHVMWLLYGLSPCQLVQAALIINFTVLFWKWMFFKQGMFHF